MKYIKYILILVILMVFFSPIIKVGAQMFTQQQMTGTQTTGQAPRATSTPVQKPVSTQKNAKEPLGECDDPVDGHILASSVTLAKCDEMHGMWTATPGYILLAPLPCENGTPGCLNGKLTNFDPTQTNNFGVYLNIMIKIFIGVCAVLSVVMIVVGGLEYMTSELSHSKEAGKEKITHAIFGLLIALGAYALLFTINPDLLKSDLNPPPATLVVTTPTFVGDDGKTQVLNGVQTGSGNYCAVVLVHLPTRKGQAPQTATNELCKPTMEECLKETSYYGTVLKSCYQKK